MRFGDRIRKLLGMEVVGDDDWDDLADLLVEGDLGAAFADESVSRLKEACATAGVRNGDGARRLLKDVLRPYAVPVDIRPIPGGRNVVMMLGVNGVGKTTSSAKLAKLWLGQGLATKAILAAGDTFRAAAIEQLKAHGDRLGVRVVAQERGSDSGAVLYDALEAAAADGSDLVIADTAGRMHTKANLIKELEKMDKIVAAKADPSRYKRLLVVDATTGQNALRQAEAFSAAVKVDGLVLTKYDSSARGGVALAIARQLGIPTAFVCDGERYEDIRAFDPETYLDQFLGLTP
ncbi:MAG TPA: signal recognition particle-docking protein FtsY [Spirochaetales bacterium]|nr:signal recognition particle-docking protein FtsY [Spirochaetales bacterium]HPG86496.1 signal recognition particle-docking protein FtsY [Spirochaetales bacterium]